LKDEKPLSLCNTCKNNKECWKSIEYRKSLEQNNIHWSHISLPWIGNKFSIFRITVIGINPYEAGGLEFYPNLIPQAKKELADGKIKINFNHPGYKGSIIWHRIGLYISQIIGNFVNDDDPINIPNISIDEAYDWLCFTNHIKCSPIGDRSEPTIAMWNNCYSILKEELQIIAPKLFLVLGTGDNIHYLLKNVIQDSIQLESTKYCRLYTGMFNGKQIGIINVPHPSAPYIGASQQISKDLDQLLINHKEILIKN
jgi:uracil-DNA glycosylase family 4